MTVYRTDDQHRGLIRVKIGALKLFESAGRMLMISVASLECLTRSRVEPAISSFSLRRRASRLEEGTRRYMRRHLHNQQLLDT